MVEVMERPVIDDARMSHAHTNVSRTNGRMDGQMDVILALPFSQDARRDQGRARPQE